MPAAQDVVEARVQHQLVHVHVSDEQRAALHQARLQVAAQLLHKRGYIVSCGIIPPPRK